MVGTIEKKQAWIYATDSLESLLVDIDGSRQGIFCMHDRDTNTLEHFGINCAFPSLDDACCKAAVCLDAAEEGFGFSLGLHEFWGLA